jgi:hypothetical protein
MTVASPSAERSFAGKAFAEISSDPMFLDEQAALAEAAFPLSEADLIERAKTFLYYGQGVEKPELLDDSFVFVRCWSDSIMATQHVLPRGSYAMRRAIRRAIESRPSDGSLCRRHGWPAKGGLLEGCWRIRHQARIPRPHAAFPPLPRRPARVTPHSDRDNSDPHNTSDSGPASL